ncbi:MAG: hypothetical protein P1U56_22855 [Saprospiraceae bacterium]|nr:hypothetical protein [Saprospiraceae bacterium]
MKKYTQNHSLKTNFIFVLLVMFVINSPLNGQSTENNNLWSILAPKVVLNNGFRNVDFQDVTLLENGDMWAITYQNIYTNRGKNKNVLVKSTDSGKTWIDKTKSIRRILAKHWTSESFKTDQMLDLTNNRATFKKIGSNGGELLLRIDSPQGNFIINSVDGGNSWSIITTLNKEILELGCGEIYSTSGFYGYTNRNNTFDSKRYVRGKEVWSKKLKKWIVLKVSKDTIVSEAGAAGLIYYKRNNDGQKLYERYRTYFNNIEDKMYYSKDKGLTWSEFYRERKKSKNGGSFTEISYDEGINWYDALQLSRSVDYYNRCFKEIDPFDMKRNIRYYMGSAIWKEIHNNGIFISNLSDGGKKDGEGYFYFVDKGKIYKSTQPLPCGCTSMNTPTFLPVFGTTVITHGYQLGGDAPIQAGDWAYNMGKSILKKIEDKGCIRRYNKKTGLFDVIRGNCKEGETILLFDWAEESNNLSEGYTEAAGDALFSALVMGSKYDNISLKDIHFIGHSRGTVVNTEALERLITLRNKNELYANTISIDQVTNLDPHDWGATNGRIVQDFDNHPNIKIPCPSSRNDYPNNGTIAWKETGFNDSYFQKGNLDLLDGREVDGTYNVDWSKEAPGHSAIHKKYLETISLKETAYKDGYKYSRISGEPRPQPKGCGDIKMSPEFDFFQPMKIYKSNTERIRGIMNGSFDRIDTRALAPGWQEHGGQKSDYPQSNIAFEKGFASLGYAPNATEPAFLRHNRCYIPKLAKSIVFKAKTINLDNGELTIYIIDAQTRKRTKAFSKQFASEQTNFTEFHFSVEDFRDEIILFEFMFKGVPLNVDMMPKLMISNVRLDQKASSELSQIIEQIQMEKTAGSKQTESDIVEFENTTKYASSTSSNNNPKSNSNTGRNIGTNNTYQSGDAPKQNAIEDNEFEATNNIGSTDNLDNEQKGISKQVSTKYNSASQKKSSNSSIGDRLFNKSQVLVNFNTGYRIAQGTHFDLNVGSIVNNDNNIFLGLGLLHHSFDSNQQSMIGIYASTKISLGYTFLTGNEFENDASIYFIGDFGYSNTLNGSNNLRGGFFTNIGLGYPLYIYKNAYLDTGITWRRLSGKRRSFNGDFNKRVFNTVDFRIGIAVYLGR